MCQASKSLSIKLLQAVRQQQEHSSFLAGWSRLDVDIWNKKSGEDWRKQILTPSCHQKLVCTFPIVTSGAMKSRLMVTSAC